MAEEGKEVIPVSTPTPEKDDELPSGFQKAIELMRRNGTDEQTQQAYQVVLEAIRAKPEYLKKEPDMDLVKEYGKSVSTSGLVGDISTQKAELYTLPRFDCPRLPLVSARNPEIPAILLDHDYHRHSLVHDFVAVDDPTLEGHSGEYGKADRKPDGQRNLAHTVLIDPGTENLPGGMDDVYLEKFVKERVPLTPTLKQRIIDAFQAFVDYHREVELHGEDDLRRGNHFRNFINGWVTRDDRKLDPLRVEITAVHAKPTIFENIISGYILKREPQRPGFGETIKRLVQRTRIGRPTQKGLPSPEKPANSY